MNSSDKSIIVYLVIGGKTVIHRLLLTAIAGLLAGAVVPGYAGIIAVSNFDNPADGADGWTVINDAIGPTRIPTGGNPGGYLQAVDQFVGLTWYWVAPGKFLGDVSAAYGQPLTFDLRQHYADLNPLLQFDEDDVVLSGNGLTLALDTPFNPDRINWTSYSVPLLASAGWRQTNIGGAPATEAQLQSVLSNLASLRIRGEFFVGPDTGDLDNVVLNGVTVVPEPGSFLLLGSGAAMLWVFRARRRSRFPQNRL